MTAAYMMLAIWPMDKLPTQAGKNQPTRAALPPNCGAAEPLVITTPNKELVVDYFRPQNYIDYLVFFEV